MSAAVTIALVIGAFFAREIIGTAVAVGAAVIIARAEKPQPWTVRP